MAIPYRTFREALQYEIEGKDFIIRTASRESPVLIMAPHGGRIELGTDIIAQAVAEDAYSFYSFQGIKQENNWMLHLDSRLFDEPRALAMMACADLVCTIHGQRGADEFVSSGGLHTFLKERMGIALRQAGFSVDPRGQKGFPALSPLNICNRGKLNMGIQMELSRGLRDALTGAGERLRIFSEAVRGVLHPLDYDLRT